jgi:hypothetical protein
MSKKVALPHEGVFTRLRPSLAVPGEVGVFAILPIAKGENPFPGDVAMVTVSEKRLRALNLLPAVYALYEYFGALWEGKRYAPPNFNLITPSWYLVNNAVNPNMGYNVDDDCFYAMKEIAPGEELTTDNRVIDGEI